MSPDPTVTLSLVHRPLSFLSFLFLTSNSLLAILPSAGPSTIEVDTQDVRTCGEKRKRDQAIVAVESQVEMSNVQDQELEPPKKMTRQMKAQLACNISFDPVTMRPVDAEEVRWLSTATMDPKVACSLCTVGSQSKPCEFLSWGIPCGNCQHGKKVVCSFKANPYKRYRARISIQPFAERTPKRLRQLLDTADLLVKVFDSACKTAGQLSELVRENYKAIDAVVHDTVEYEGCAIAEESLVTDVSTINGILGIFDTCEVDPSTISEYREPIESPLYSLRYDDLCHPQERFPRASAVNVTDGVDMGALDFEKPADGEADVEGDQDPDLV
ncbi:hypothetical protein EV421DRAFT_1742598 [Armillaria borealis]|uniref:Uncharacterized protein n=1 Tax=Armillaria borealis TaxID=47425 RepID=A0AA39MFQ6_9AGAR|nr:hypothetical protein EV421DRAFT_1742598 [Armillaria borealis]